MRPCALLPTSDREAACGTAEHSWPYSDPDSQVVAAEAAMMMTAAAYPKAEKTSGMSQRPHPRVSDSSTASACRLVHDFLSMFGEILPRKPQNGEVHDGLVGQ